MGFWSMVGKNISGTPDKAYILMSEPDAKRDEDDVYSLSSTVDAFTSKANQATSQEFNSLKNIRIEPEISGFKAIPVQYNPNKIYLSSSKGQSITRNSNVGGDELGLQENIRPYTSTLRMELIFDDTVNSDAFSSLDAGSLVNTGLAKKGITTIANVVNTHTIWGGHTVQDISELFVAAVTSYDTRLVCVLWNKTAFWGELCSVSVDYTMFNSFGNPIRSRVNIEVMQTEVGDNNQGAVQEVFNNMLTESKNLASNQKLTGSSTIYSDIFNLQ